MKRLLLLPLLAMATAAFSADKDVEELLAKMRDTYKNIGTVSFTVEGTRKTQMGDLTIQAKVQFASPNKCYAELSVGDESGKVSCDGENVYVMQSSDGQAASIPYSEDALGQALAGNLESLSFFDWKRQLSTAEGDNMEGSDLILEKEVEWNDKKWILLKETAPQVGVYVEYFIDPKTNLIHRTLMYSEDKSEQLGEWVIKSIEVGAKVDESKFAKLGG